MAIAAVHSNTMENSKLEPTSTRPMLTGDESRTLSDERVNFTNRRFCGVRLRNTFRAQLGSGSASDSSKYLLPVNMIAPTTDPRYTERTKSDDHCFRRSIYMNGPIGGY